MQAMSLNLRRTISSFAIGPVIVVLLAACGGGASAAPSEVSASLTSYAITLSANTAKAGEVVFHVKNVATDLPHEFLVVQTNLAADKLPMNAEGIVDEEKLGETHELTQMDPGKGGDLTLKLAAGHYLLMCNLPGHFPAGMHTEFTVTP
jgi:uncharacterized cupredoxin-like copper-binding protein